ncbi:MAG: hypothetical protein ACYDBB_16720 [Armatimonadota bacterium]
MPSTVWKPTTVALRQKAREPGKELSLVVRSERRHPCRQVGVSCAHSDQGTHLEVGAPGQTCLHRRTPYPTPSYAPTYGEKALS